MASPPTTFKPLPEGVFPTMITPFKASGASGDAAAAMPVEVDYEALEELVEWYIQSGVAGLFSVCQSSEMWHLSDSEKLQVAQAVVKASRGRVPVVACGNFGDTLEEQAKFVNRMAEIVDAVVVVTCTVVPETKSDGEWVVAAKKLLDLTPGVPLGLYECPLPYKRLLSPETLAWAAGTGRFLFHKDTSCSKHSIEAKIKALPAGTPFRFFNANVATLQFSLQAGGHGFSGISANFYPWLHVWLVKNHEAAPETAKVVQSFLTVAESLVEHKYPKSAKTYLAQRCGLKMNPCGRVTAGTSDFDEEEALRLAGLSALMEVVSLQTGIKPVASGVHSSSPGESPSANGRPDLAEKK